jgi:hypothetical protein
MLTDNQPQNNTDTSLPQDKVDPNISQQKVDQNVRPNEPASDEVIDPNWKVVRERLKKEKQDREQAEKKASEKEAEVTALKAAMEAAFSKMASPSQPQNQYEFQEETEEQRIRRMIQDQVSQIEQNIENKIAEKEKHNYPNKLSQIYSDFYQTISEENLAYLDHHYPEVSSPLKRLGDDFDKWNDIYKAVKKFVPNSKDAKKDSARAEANSMKPRSMSSTGMTQSGEAPGRFLTKEQKAANWERMQKSRKGLS